MEIGESVLFHCVHCRSTGAQQWAETTCIPCQYTFQLMLAVSCTTRADMALLAENHSVVLNSIFSQRAQCSKKSHMVNVSASSRDNDDIQGGKQTIFQM